MSDYLHLAVDNNVELLPVGNLMDVADMARRFADQVTAGEHGEVIRALVLVENADGIAGFLWGENASSIEKMGMLQTLQMRIFQDDHGE